MSLVMAQLNSKQSPQSTVNIIELDSYVIPFISMRLVFYSSLYFNMTYPLLQVTSEM